MAMLERETSVQIGGGGGLTCETIISGSPVQSLQKASLAAETTGGKMLVAFWPKHDLRINLRVPKFKYFPGGAYTPRPPAC